MTTIWAQILIASKNILVGGNALHRFKIIAIINDVTASTCSLEKMGCTQKTVFRTSGTSILLCACTFCFDMPWDFYHLSWNLPKSNSSVLFVSVHDITSSMSPRMELQSQLCFFPFSHVLYLFSHQVLLASSLPLESLLPISGPWSLWKVRPLW